MKLEINQKLVSDHNFKTAGLANCVLTTPPISENYWSFRVALTDNQAVVAFPKFCTMGIGFQKEEDWNTNLPFTVEAERIYDHIKHNAGSEKIRKEDVIKAIKMLQAACASRDEQLN